MNPPYSTPHPNPAGAVPCTQFSAAADMVMAGSPTAGPTFLRHDRQDRSAISAMSECHSRLGGAKLEEWRIGKARYHWDGFSALR